MHLVCFVLQVRNYLSLNLKSCMEPWNNYGNYIGSEDSVLYILCRTCTVLDNCSEFQLLLTLYVTYILFPALFCDLQNKFCE